MLREAGFRCVDTFLSYEDAESDKAFSGDLSTESKAWEHIFKATKPE